MSHLPVPSSQYPVATGSSGFPITPSDTADLPKCTLKLYVGVSGDVTCILNNQNPIVGVEELDPATAGAGGTLSNLNLTYSSNSSANATAVSLDTMSSGKFYFEATVTNPVETFAGGAGEGLTCVGITTVNTAPNGIVGWNQSGHGVGISADFSGANVAGIYVNRDGTNDFHDAVHVLATGDVIGVALDLTTGANKVSFYRNGTLVYTEDLTAHGLGGLTWHFGVSTFELTHAGAVATNFGATPYAEVPPTGFANLFPSTSSITFKAMPVGMYDLAISRVLNTGTTATHLVGVA